MAYVTHPGGRAEESSVAAPARHYHLRCPLCQALIEEDGVHLQCPEAHEPALARRIRRAVVPARSADNLETLPRLQLFEEMEGIDTGATASDG